MAYRGYSTWEELWHNSWVTLVDPAKLCRLVVLKLGRLLQRHYIYSVHNMPMKYKISDWTDWQGTGVWVKRLDRTIEFIRIGQLEGHEVTRVVMQELKEGLGKLYGHRLQVLFRTDALSALVDLGGPWEAPLAGGFGSKLYHQGRTHHQRKNGISKSALLPVQNWRVDLLLTGSEFCCYTGVDGKVRLEPVNPWLKMPDNIRFKLITSGFRKGKPRVDRGGPTFLVTSLHWPVSGGTEFSGTELDGVRTPLTGWIEPDGHLWLTVRAMRNYPFRGRFFPQLLR